VDSVVERVVVGDNERDWVPVLEISLEKLWCFVLELVRLQLPEPLGVTLAEGDGEGVLLGVRETVMVA
jgi:hypothetical protein